MARAFISHARADEDAARHLADELERRNLQVVSMDRLVAPGESWVAQLENAISQSDVVFVLVSPESEKSQWLASETALALVQAEKGRTRVVPVLVDRRAQLPDLLQSIQGIELFDRERSQRQLDALVQLLQSGATPDKDRWRDLELTYVKASRKMLAEEIALDERKRAVRSLKIVADVTTIAVLAGLFAVIIIVSVLIGPRGAWAEFNVWALPFGLGVLTGLLGFLLSAVFHRRLTQRDRHKEVEVE